MDRNAEDWLNAGSLSRSLSARRAWIEIMIHHAKKKSTRQVALRKESVDRNAIFSCALLLLAVALRKESVDRNLIIGGIRVISYGRSPQGERG